MKAASSSSDMSSGLAVDSSNSLACCVNKTHSCKQHAGPHLGTGRGGIELCRIVLREATEATTDAQDGCSRRVEVWWMGSDIDVSNGLLEVFRSPASALSSALGRPYGVVAFTALRCDRAACAFAEFA